jgi:hypothetical protein
MTAQAPLMERVTLHGGPLNGRVRHVPRGATVARLKPPLGDRPETYRLGPDGVWRHAGATP